MATTGPRTRQVFFMDRLLGHSELIQLWMKLPDANRQRLLWLLSQLLEHQLSAVVAKGEDSDESAPRY